MNLNMVLVLGTGQSVTFPFIVVVFTDTQNICDHVKMI